MPNKTPKKERVPGPYDDKKFLKHVATTVQRFKHVAGVSEEQKQELFNALMPHSTITDVTFDNGKLLHYLDQHYNPETNEFRDTLPACFAVYIAESKKKIQETKKKKRESNAKRNAAKDKDRLIDNSSAHDNSGDNDEDDDNELVASDKVSEEGESEDCSTVNQPELNADVTTPMRENEASGVVNQDDSKSSGFKRKSAADSDNNNN